MKKSLLALIMIFAMVVGNVGTVYAEEPSEGQPAVQEQVDLTVSESTPEITEAPSADFEREDLTGSGELIPEIPEENISEPDEAQAGVEGVSIPKDENVSLEIAETETQPAGEDTETETELIQTPTAIVAEDDPEEEIEAVQPFDYNGDSIAFIKEDGSGFGMYAAQDGTTAVLSENEVKITYLPKSTTVYLGFYYGDIRLSDDWVDYIELKDDKFEFTVSREKCGKAWPVAPVKADGISTTSTQYYLAIPSEDKLEKEEEPALNIVPITLTDEMPVILTGTPVYYSFTPEESGLYFLNLYSKYEDFGEQYKGMLDGAYYELLDDSMNYINASQDSMAAELQAGRTYYYRAYNYYGDYEISGYLELRKEQTVTITYVTDNNGYFDEDPESRSKQCNVAINQSVDGVWPTPFNDDVRFAGWASSPDATEPEYIEADCEKTVYAVWHQQFKVTFHVNNPDAYYEEWDDTIDDYIHSDVTIDLLPKGYIIYGSEWYYVPAFPENIIFAGWSENPFATEADEEIVINGDKDLYTVWKTAYPVTFYSNDGENAYFAGRDYDEEGNLVIIKEASWRADYQEGTLLQDLLFNELTNDNEGKVFGGWGLTADASEPADVTLDGSFTEVYAIWVPGATVTYHVNNDDIDAYYSVWEGEYEQYLKEWTGKYALGTIITKEDQIPEGDWEWSDNVFFAGWSTNPDADFAGDIEITSTDKKDLYAVWRERKEDNNLTAYVADVDYETQDWWTSSEIGETLSFGVVADADDPSCITYQWYKREWKEDDWKPISGAVGSTFETGPLTTRTFYYCRVDDGFGNSVVINYYVYIENHLNAYIADVDYETQDWTYQIGTGEKASLGVIADADDPSNITYQWYMSDWEEIAGANKSTYETEAVYGAEQYYCIVADGYGNEQNLWFHVRVNDFHAFVAGTGADPQTFAAYAIAPGEKQKLEVEISAEDESRVVYTWYQYTILENEYTEWVPIPDAPASQYEAGDGEYYCHIEDGYGNNEYVYFTVSIDNQFTAAIYINDRPYFSHYILADPEQPFTAQIIVTALDTSKLTYQGTMVDLTITTIPDEYITAQDNGEGTVTLTVTIPGGPRFRYIDCFVSDGYGHNQDVIITPIITSNIDSILLNEEKEFTLVNAEKWFEFVPEETGRYVIVSDEHVINHVLIFDQDLNFLHEDCNINKFFSNLNAGERYYYRFTCPYSEEIDYSVLLRKAYEGEQSPSEGEQTPSEGEQTPSEGEQTPSEGEQTPSEGEQTPSEGEVKALHSLELEGEIAVNFYYNMTAEQAANARVEFTLRDNTITVTSFKKTSNGYRCSVSIAAKEATEPIEAKLYIGEKLANTDHYSVKIYTDGQLAGEGNEKLDTLMKAMLNYGARSQLYFGNRTDDLANKDLTEAEKQVPPLDASSINCPSITNDEISAGVKASGLKYRGATLALESSTTVTFYFRPDGITQAEALGLKAYVDGKQVTLFAKGKDVCFQIPDIAAKKLGDTHTVKIGNYEFQYSALNYIKNIVSSSSDAALVETVTALYYYYQAAKDYFNY